MPLLKPVLAAAAAGGGGGITVKDADSNKRNNNGPTGRDISLTLDAAAGDVLLAFTYLDSTSASRTFTCSAPTGTTEHFDEGPDTASARAAYSKVLVSGDISGGQVTVTCQTDLNGGQNHGLTAIVLTASGTLSVDVIGTRQTAFNSDSVAAPAITTGQDNDKVVAFASWHQAVTSADAPSQGTLRASHTGSPAGQVCSFVQATAGSTGTTTLNVTGPGTAEAVGFQMSVTEA